MKKYLSILIFPIIFSCNSLRTATFDQTAYQKTVEIKVEADKLIDISKEDYSLHEKDIENLKNQVAFILEYEKNRPNNEISYTMWELMNNKDKSLLMGYFELWKKNKTLSSSFSEEAKKQIDEAFSILLKYESSKTKENEANLLDIINMKK
ncbi:hypothetical protein C3729_09865 [Cloacibacterium normanense]|uniref:Lipoprotein n=1 Tax=Cloacibacterium normanense TaxID=237258 RepID=A0A2S7I314_9FLAO|nr:hypothetical protein [Cloacibacterium normanense]PPZ90978.1 hypothetical protein C3729_09865 [Cloacibacterium normanense]